MKDEVAIRLGFFIAIFATMIIWELLAPRRTLTTSNSVRWFANLAIISLNAAVVRLLFPLLPVGLALLAQKKGWGLLNGFDTVYWLKVVAGVAVLDLQDIKA